MRTYIYFQIDKLDQPDLDQEIANAKKHCHNKHGKDRFTNKIYARGEIAKKSKLLRIDKWMTPQCIGFEIVETSL